MRLERVIKKKLFILDISTKGFFLRVHKMRFIVDYLNPTRLTSLRRWFISLIIVAGYDDSICTITCLGVGIHLCYWRPGFKRDYVLAIP